MKQLPLLMILCLSSCALFDAERSIYQSVSKKLPSGSTAISADGLVAAYDFETFTEEGELYDFSPQANHGRLSHTHSVEGVYGNALAFSNKEDVIILPNNPSLNLTGPLTVAARVKITTPQLHQHLLACNDLFVLWLTTTNKYRFADTLGQGFTTQDSVAAVEQGMWHSVVAVLSTEKGEPLTEQNIKIFVDGVQLQGKHQTTWAPTTLAANNACVIGGTRNGPQKHQDLQFEGVIDELLIYSRALREQEIIAFSN